MVAKVVVKLGGGLITDKSSIKTPRLDIIDSICDEISNLVSSGNSVIIVHGAGSYGHLLAKKWSLSQGLRKDFSRQRREAVQIVRSDMRELSSLVSNSLRDRGLETITFPLRNGPKTQEPPLKETFQCSILLMVMWYLLLLEI